MSLAKRVRDCRYAKGWGPDELASRAEISRTALYQIESGKTELPRAGTLRRIARALDVSIDVLLGNSEIGSFQLATFGQGEVHALSGDHVRADWIMEEEGAFAGSAPAREEGSASRSTPESGLAERERILTRMLHDLLASPLGEGVARIVEESHRLIPGQHDD